MMIDFEHYKTALTGFHHHLCPKQVLGVRTGLAAGAHLGIALPQNDKRLFALIETDGCFADGIVVATGCTAGHRTLRHIDFGKVAATFVDTQTGRAVRIRPSAQSRQLACDYEPGAPDSWHAQLEAYQRMPESDLLSIVEVRLSIDLHAMISEPGLRTRCNRCGEEVINGREVTFNGQTLCRACGGEAYYRAVESAPNPRA